MNVNERNSSGRIFPSRRTLHRQPSDSRFSRPDITRSIPAEKKSNNNAEDSASKSSQVSRVENASDLQNHSPSQTAEPVNTPFPRAHRVSHRGNFSKSSPTESLRRPRHGAHAGRVARHDQAEYNPDTSPTSFIATERRKSPLSKSAVSEFSQDSPTQTPTVKSVNEFVTAAEGSIDSAFPAALTTELQEEERVKRHGVRTFVIIIVILALLCTGAYFAWKMVSGDSHSNSRDYSGPGTETTTVTINEGDVGITIGQKLEDAGVIKSVPPFIRSLEANKAEAKIRPGTYTLKKEMASKDAVAALLSGANRKDNTVAVLSGQTKTDVFKNISSAMNIPIDQVREAASDTAAIGLPGIAEGNIEGWLAPGTYEFKADDTPATVIKKMVSATLDTLKNAGVPPEKFEVVLTKASIIEREVNRTEYMPKISRIIDNRLADKDGETHGVLQMDSTVLYGVGKSGGIPNKEDRDSDNPYNTYLHPGLPPTPIAQPTKEAIKASVNPEPGSWLYFVAVDLETGETLFSTTLSEHEKNVAKLTDYCKRSEGKCTVSGQP